MCVKYFAKFQKEWIKDEEKALSGKVEFQSSGEVEFQSSGNIFISMGFTNTQ